MGPILIASLASWAGYEYGQYRNGKGLFAPKKPKLDRNLETFQKLEVYNALYNNNDPQALHVMAMGLQLSPIAGNLIEQKSQALQAKQPYTVPDYDFT